MALAVPCIPAEPPSAIPGEDDRLRPPPPAGEKPPPTICNLDHLRHHSATTAAQRITAIKKHTRNICARPFLLNFTPKQMPREPGIEPQLQMEESRAALLYRPGKTIAPTAGVKRPRPRSISPPTGRQERPVGSPPSAKGHWDAAVTDNRSEPLETQPSALSTQPSFPRAPPTPALGGAVMFLGTLGAVTHRPHPRSRRSQ